jgi:hypothetical protein
MTATMCATGCGRPTSAVLCPPCAEATADALAKLASWSLPVRGVAVDTATRVNMPGWHKALDDAGLTPSEQLFADKYGQRPSSPFDLPSGSAMLGGSKALAVELDVARSRQGRRGDQLGPRPAPGSKIWWPFEGGREATPGRAAVRPRISRLDEAERDLTRAVQHWVATLAQGEVVAPHVIVEGHVLARACTWLLWHVHDITVHAQAADAHRAFCDVALAIEKLVDRPEDRVYVGPCFQTVDSTECRTDMYARPGEPFVQCASCGHVVKVEERRAWLADHLEEVELTAVESCRALAAVGVVVNDGHVRGWATRGSLLSRGKVRKDGRMRPTYRVGDVMLLAYRAAEDPRAERRAAKESELAG